MGPAFAAPRPPHPTLPLVTAVGAIAILTASLLASKLLLDQLIRFSWPIAVYVSILALVGYGPSVAWCWYVSRRYASGRFRADIGLTPRWSDLGWGPVVWLAAIGCQVAAAVIVQILDLPLSNNTDGVGELSADRTYVVSVVISAVIAAPLVEEMVFRGVVLRGLLGSMPAVAAVALQGVLFGLAHVDPVRGAGNVGLVAVLSMVGVALGGAALLLRRIGPTIVAHAIFNGVVLTLVLTGVADRVAN